MEIKLVIYKDGKGIITIINETTGEVLRFSDWDMFLIGEKVEDLLDLDA